MKIYMAGSIRGAGTNFARMDELIAFAKQFGEVLTEHIFIHNGNEVRKMSDAQIYEQDLGWVTESDVVIAEVSNPSLGVGYEIGRSVAFGKPVLCLYHNSLERTSAMIGGNKSLIVKSYGDIVEAKEHITDFLVKCN